MRTALWGVVAMAALLVLYLAFTVQYAVILLLDPLPLVKAMGAALLVLPVIAVWWLVVEFAFIVRGQRLLARLAAEGGLPPDDLPRLASGRVDAKAAEARFPAAQADVEAAPEDWRAWLRLSLAYDAAADRPRARWALREAIRLSRATPRA